MEALILTTDCYGQNGGIAKYCRDLVGALVEMKRINQVVIFSRNLTSLNNVPNDEKIDYRVSKSTSKLNYSARFFWHGIKNIFKPKHEKLVICCHVNLLILAFVASVIGRSKLILFIYGIEAWSFKMSPLHSIILKRVSKVISISNFTRLKFLDQIGNHKIDTDILPCSVDLKIYGIKSKSDELLSKYDLHDNFVLMTLCRLSSSEKYKGVDEMLELIPELVLKLPEIKYVVVGDGDDLNRLKTKAEELKVSQYTVFVGYVDDTRKAEHLQLADAFIMAGYGEGFGIVYLEAMACGVPVIASSKDGSSEAVLGGRIGVMVDPSKSNQIINEIVKISKNTKKEIPRDLSLFSIQEFCRRLDKIMETV